MSVTVEYLAHQLYVDVGDVRYLAEWISEDPISHDALSAELCGEIRRVLDGPALVRSHPHCWLRPDAETWRDEHGLRKPGDGLNHAPGRTFGGFDPSRDDRP